MKLKFKIKGLDCANCAAELERAIQKVDGVESATISFMAERMTLEIDEERKEEVIEKVNKVVKIEEFGCFVQIWPGCEGLVHISALAKEHVKKTEDVVKLGDEIIVKCLGYDKKGRLNFSRKDALN